MNTLKNMTMTFFFLLLVWSYTAHAGSNWAFPVEGSLEISRDNGALIAVLSLKNGNDVKLVSFPRPISSCTAGTFVIAPDTTVKGAYRLLNIENCQHKIEKGAGLKGGSFERDPNLSSFPLVCPEIYRPVCGQEAESNLYRTFGNECELEGYGAKMIHKGECVDEHLLERFQEVKKFGPVKFF
jgi:hypothetical protein